ncbi:MAG: hypothetical protein ABEK12_00855, partial [Candidatus Nanohaloarchaea archaeon]
QAAGVVPPRFRFPLVAALWTVLLVLYAVVSRRFGLDSPLVKVPFLLIILGEVVILLYVVAEYYGISRAFLPF